MSTRDIKPIQYILRTFALLLTAIGLSAAAHSASAADWQPDRVHLAGSDERIWVIAASKDEGKTLPVVRFWTSDKETPAPRANLQPTSGDPIAFAADKNTLRVLYSDLSLWRFEPKAFPTTDALFISKSDLPPLAVAGDAAQNATWFLVDAASLRAPEPDPTTAPAEDDEPASQPTTSQPASAVTGLALLRLERGFWTRIDVPAFAVGFDEYRLSVRDDVVHLFWLRKDASAIAYSKLANDEWTMPSAAISGAKIERFWAGASRDRTVLVIGTPADVAGKIELSLVYRANSGDKGWVRSKPASPGNAPLNVPADRVSAAIARDQLAIAYIDKGNIRFAKGSIDIAPTVRFSNLSNLVATQESSRQRWRDFIQTAVLLLLFTIVLATKRDQMQTPAAVPKGYVLASIWRRGVATLIDISPAAILILLLYRDSVMPMLQTTTSTAESLMQDPAEIAKMDKIWMLFVAVYGAWCIILEGLGQTTLGKRILNCRVLSADGTAPTGKQIVIRNLLRVLVVGMGMSGLLVTFMLMAMFTVNRQRLGDILGNTIVVQPAPTPLEDGIFHRSDDRDSHDDNF